MARVFLCPVCRRRWANGEMTVGEMESALYAHVGSPDCRYCGGPITGPQTEGQLSLL